MTKFLISLFCLLYASNTISAQIVAQVQNWNQQGQEAQLLYDLSRARKHYQRSIAVELDSSDYLLVQEQLKALKGLRAIAILEEEYTEALQYHDTYMNLLEFQNSYVYNNLKPLNDKIKASCLQQLGQSQAALELLANYAFGKGVTAGGGIDKSIIDYLSELLMSKYPKKSLKQLLPNIQQQIKLEDTGNGIDFYLQFYEDKIYFPKDSYKYGERIAQGQVQVGEAIAHYQIRLSNSYFYQQLVQKL